MKLSFTINAAVHCLWAAPAVELCRLRVAHKPEETRKGSPQRNSGKLTKRYVFLSYITCAVLYIRKLSKPG